MAERAWLLAGEHAGMRYRVETPRQALAGRAGVRSGVRTGVSLDFSDYREYYPGDDLRTLDWGVYARTDKLTVKLFHEEVSPHVDIIVDGTASMALADTEKARGAAWMAAMLWTAARNGECTARAWLLGDRVDPLGETTRRPGEWETMSFGSSSDPQRMLAAAGPVWKRRGLRFLVSDLFWEGEPTQAVRKLSGDAAQLVVVQLLAKGDVEPPPRGRWRLSSEESSGFLDLFVDAGAQARYRAALAQHQAAWRDACRQCGAIFLTVVAEDVLAEGRVEGLERSGVLVMG